MTTDLFTVLPHEWDVLCGVIDALVPDGPVNDPLLASPRGGVDPFWRLTGADGIEVSVVHELDEPRQSGPHRNVVVVPTALVRHGHLLAHTEEGCDLLGETSIVAPSGEVRAMAVTVGDELVVAEADLDLCANFKETLFDFARYRRPEVYGRITGQRGPEVPGHVRAALGAPPDGGPR